MTEGSLGAGRMTKEKKHYERTELRYSNTFVFIPELLITEKSLFQYSFVIPVTINKEENESGQ